MLVKRTYLSFALIVALATAAFTQQKPASHPQPSVERLRSHVTYLASDKLEGRRTGTQGANDAARYIAEEFARNNLQPGGSRPHAVAAAPGVSRYMQQFPFVAGVELGKNNSLLVMPRAVALEPQRETAIATAAGTRADSPALRLGEDWTPLGFSSNANVRNAHATFVGYGIIAAELGHDDYAGADVRGRIVFVLSGTPDVDNPHGQFSRYADVRRKAIAAREKGAAALVIIERTGNLLDGKLERLSYDNSAGDVDLPVVVVTPRAASQLLLAGGLAPLAELERAAQSARSAASPSSVNSSAGSISEKRKSMARPLQNVTLSLTTDILRREASAMNVVGILEGSDPHLKNETVVIGAHYDHLGRGGAGSLASREGKIHHGADDNASGVAALIELSRIFSAKEMRPRRSIIFIAFGGEEEGLLGSNYYVNHPIIPLGQTVAMINMDMIGRQKENRLMIGGAGTAAEWRNLINAANQAVFKIELPQTGGAINSVKIQRFSLTLDEDGYGPSDHSSFYAKQVPVLFFFTGDHEDYHKPSDTADKIDYEGESRVVSLIAIIVRSMDASDKRPTYSVAKSEVTRRATSFRVTLGVVPNYAEAGEGMKINGVRDDSPAAKAGLLAGDRITKLAGREVRNVYDYTYALGEMKAGEEYEIEVVRASQTLKLKITPTARK